MKKIVKFVEDYAVHLFMIGFMAMVISVAVYCSTMPAGFKKDIMGTVIKTAIMVEEINSRTELLEKRQELLLQLEEQDARN